MQSSLCRSEVCRSLGGVGELRVPKRRRVDYEQELGVADPINVKAPRIWIGHVAQADLVARKRSTGRGTAEIAPADDALPTHANRGTDR